MRESTKKRILKQIPENMAVYLLRAKHMELTLSELDELDEGAVMDMVIESGNALCDDEYQQVATQCVGHQIIIIEDVLITSDCFLDK
jgi:hypothetical protein